MKDALRLACEHIEAFEGTCPYDVHSLECSSWEDWCEANCKSNVDMAACWERYFKGKEKHHG